MTPEPLCRICLARRVRNLLAEGELDLTYLARRTCIRIEKLDRFVEGRRIPGRGSLSATELLLISELLDARDRTMG